MNSVEDWILHRESQYGPHYLYQTRECIGGFCRTLLCKREDERQIILSAITIHDGEPIGKRCLDNDHVIVVQKTDYSVRVLHVEPESKLTMSMLNAMMDLYHGTSKLKRFKLSRIKGLRWSDTD